MRVACFSCDCYADLTPSWEYTFHKAWPNCPHEVVYIGNSKPLKVSGKVYYTKRKDADFGGRMGDFISKHVEKDELIFFVLVDHLVKALNADVVAQAEKLCAHQNVAFVRLFPMPHPQLPFPKDLRSGVKWSKFGQLDKSKPYSFSTQPSIWDAHKLAKLFREGESPWHAETFGSGRTKQVKEIFLGTHDPAVSYVNFWYRRRALGVNWVKDNVPEQFWPVVVKK
jgi:hypothetical protein